MLTADDILPAFVALLIASLHNTDSALQVAPEVPDWRKKFQEALQNPLRKQHTDRLAALVQEIGDAVVEKRADGPEFIHGLMDYGKRLT